MRGGRGEERGREGGKGRDGGREGGRERGKERPANTSLIELEVVLLKFTSSV